MPRARLGLALALALATAAVAIPAAAFYSVAPTSAATGCEDGWRRIPLTNGAEKIEPHGAASLNGQPAWIVGGPIADVQRPHILAWRTDHWVSVAPPWSGYGSLTAVDAAGANAAWTVGSVGRPVGNAVVAKWNGTSWRAVKAPPVGGAMRNLADVVAVSSSKAWVVGSRLVSGQVKPVAALRSSGAWLNYSPAVDATQEAGLTAAQRSPDKRLWVGGWRTDDGLQQPWLMYRADGQWHQVTVDAVDGLGAITDIAFRTANDGWLTGYVEHAGGGGYVPLLQHWNGSTWTNVASPWGVGDSVLLNSVAVDASGRISVAGVILKDGERRAALASFDGSTWTVRDLPGSLNPTSSYLTAAAGLTSGGFVAGIVSGAAATFATCPATGFPAATSVVSGPRPTTVAVDPDPTSDTSLPSPTVAAVDIDGLVARDRTAAAGLTMKVSTFEGLVRDFDDDSFPDIFINRHVEDVPRLMMGSASGEFTELSLPWQWQDRHGCTAGDVDGDDAMDLFCTVGAARGTRSTPNELLLHPGLGQGVVATSQYGVLDAWGRGRSATLFNLDGDEFPDLYMTSEPERIDALQSANRLFRNVNGEYFEPVPSWQLNRSMGGSCTVSADIDDDGDDDLFICVTKKVDGMIKGARLYINDDGTLVERTSAWGITPILDDDIEIADFDGDGQLDLAQLNTKQVRVSLQRPGGFKYSFSYSLTRAVAMAVGDVNGDERADIYVSQRTAGNDDHVMLVNNGGGANFTSMTIPQAPGGSAQGVLAIDYDGNGLTDFVTLNGRYSAGPIKLIAFYLE